MVSISHYSKIQSIILDDKSNYEYNLFYFRRKSRYTSGLSFFVFRADNNDQSAWNIHRKRFWYFYDIFKTCYEEIRVWLSKKYDSESLNSPNLHIFIWSPAGISNLSTREKRREFKMTRLQRSSCLISPTASYYPTHREFLLIINFANWRSNFINISAILYGLYIMAYGSYYMIHITFIISYVSNHMVCKNRQFYWP